MRLALHVDGDHHAPGGEITGRVEVLNGGPSRTLTLTVAMRERSTELQATAHASSGVIHEGDLVTGQSVPFRFTLPPDALPAVSAGHSGLFWELELRSDEPGLDTVVRAPLHVVVA